MSKIIAIAKIQTKTLVNLSNHIDKAAVTQDFIARSSNIGPIALVRTLNIV